MMFRPSIASDFEYVLANLRQEDQIEMAATGGNFSDFWAQQCVSLTIYENNIPVCVFGATRDGDVATMFRLATDLWPEVIGQAIRFGRRYMLPKLKECGIKRVEAIHRDVPGATAWLRLFGAKKDRVFERSGEKFAVFAVDLT